MKRLIAVLPLVLPVAAALPISAAGAADLPALKAVAPLSMPASLVPRSAWFAGLGGSVNSQSFESQNIFAQGVSDIFLGGTQVAFGQAGGPTTPSLGTQTSFAPTAQLGFFQHVGGSDWLWGAKVSYSYLNAHSTDNRVRDPQVGSFTSATPDTFTGNVVIGSYQRGITHQINFIPFIGHSFERSMVYAGVGPSLSQVKSSLNNVVGFAAINGQHLNITGQPSNFASTQWVLGAAATVGGTYYIDRSWFIDMNYTFGITKNQTSSFSGPFASATDGYTDTGILSGNWSGHIITQAVAVSINKAF
jgi:outer membrane protein W